MRQWEKRMKTLLPARRGLLRGALAAVAASTMKLQAAQAQLD
jgi:hypothetical protein